MPQVGRHEAPPGQRAELQRLVVRGREEQPLVFGEVHAAHRGKVELPGQILGTNLKDVKGC